ncbi:diacylglycerol kinase family lipid kinase [Niveispirillum sp. SYP-B3756]|uniref:diacylglycerol/lipid kinase family protein n=1 Tax=Niveispirillum sp. SYP-B3756 TaxID=2662178 RepID=UPI001292B1BC|nr:diacylglycerol kinase family protein [Niveispirillum sp. SYP-B3756]MQP67678.1 diacylglycerol kinase family lipid kinase [Niveispirillum sp. SYP-B3756]
MRLAIVMNSQAGSLLQREPAEVIDQVTKAFTAAGHQVDCICVPSAAVGAAMEKAASSGADILVVGGGDGTIKTGAEIALRHGIAFGLLPLGTMNLLARDLCIPLELEGAMAALAQGVVRPIDVAYINDTPFLNNAVIGLYARMVHEREKLRQRRGWRKWPAMGWALVKTIASNPRLTVTLALADGTTKRVDTHMVAIANNAYEEGYGPVPHRERLDDGRLSLYIGKHRTRWGLVQLFLRALLSKWKNDPELEVHHVTAATVHSRHRHLRVAIDGELERRRTPLRFRIEPGQLRVWHPVGAETVREGAASQRAG